jgi:hypothetical protein
MRAEGDRRKGRMDAVLTGGLRLDGAGEPHESGRSGKERDALADAVALKQGEAPTGGCAAS